MFLNDILLKAVSWTLIHSIWQGCILALLAALVVLFTRKSSAAFRYLLFTGLFLMFAIGVGFTFSYEFQNEQTATIARLNLPVLTQSIDNTTTVSGDFGQMMIIWLNRNANLIVLLWFLIFCFKCVGIFKGLNHVYQIRNHKTQLPSEYWTLRVKELCDTIQLQKRIILLESQLVKVPSVTGFLKPMILLPAGLLSSLPPNQIEAILLHELAHIRRKDYFVNILQSFMEVIFFFNPGVLWLSTLIKEERENCCDDIAISVTQSKRKFVDALVSFEEYNQNQQFVMGFGRNRNHLLSRAKRIIYNDNKPLDAIEKTFLSLSVVLIAFVVLACSDVKIDSWQTAENQSKKEIQKQVNLAKAEDIKAAAADESVLNEDAKAQAADEAVALADERAAIAVRNANLADKKFFQQKQSEPSEIKINTVVNTQKEELKPLRTVVSSTKTDNSTVTTYENSNVPSQRKTTSVRTGVTGENLPEDLHTDGLARDIINDLLADRIINTTVKLSYKLSNNSLIVNNVVQPINKFRAYKDKYVKAKMFAICYNYEVSDAADLKN